MSVTETTFGPDAPAPDTAWADVQRLEGWAGEVRVNLLRLATLVAFYGQHVVNAYLVGTDSGLRGAFHARVTGLVVAWLVGIVALHVCLLRRWVPPWLKFAAVGWDVALVTTLLALPGVGPKSPLLVLYFLVIASTTLRLSLPLVYTATFASMAGYMVALGAFVFLHVGADKYYAEGFADRVPRHHEVMFLFGLGGAGLIAGQAVRQARRLVLGHPVVVVEPTEK